MKTITVSLAQHTYPIYIGHNLLERSELMAPYISQKKAIIVSNPIVARYYLTPLKLALQQAAINTHILLLPDGEKHKNWQQLDRIIQALLEQHGERSTPLIALGGGVIGDITGLAATLYYRGIPYLQIPTTLLAQVDAAIGGKTAINYHGKKNILGSFYQPQMVLADINTLNSLSQRQFCAGLAEVVKYAAINDIDFFEWLEQNIHALRQRDGECLLFAIQRCCQHKAALVSEDEHDQGQRAWLNFGHTFAHAIETECQLDQYLHGEAVAIGMLFAAQASAWLGNLPQHDVMRLKNLLHNAGLPTKPPPLTLDNYLEAMRYDKKVRHGRIQFILLKALGKAYHGELEKSLLERLLTAKSSTVYSTTG